MTTMTYTSLNETLQAYLDRTDAKLQAQIPNFINLGEIRCAREVKNLGTKTSVVGVMSAGVYVYPKPSRWLEVISINFGTATENYTLTRANAAGVRTLTFASPHSFVVGNTINVFNVGGTAYNGEFTVSAVTQLSVSYSSGSGTEAATADTAGIITGSLSESKTLYPRSYEFCTEYWKNREETGEPKFYADYDYNNWLIVPTPKMAYPFEVNHFERPQPLSTDNETNWFTQTVPDLLLYACLLETAPYLKNDQRIPTWKDYYTQAANSIKNENKERKMDATLRRNE